MWVWGLQARGGQRQAQEGFSGDPSLVSLGTEQPVMAALQKGHGTELSLNYHSIIFAPAFFVLGKQCSSVRTVCDLERVSKISARCCLRESARCFGGRVGVGWVEGQGLVPQHPAIASQHC